MLTPQGFQRDGMQPDTIAARRFDLPVGGELFPILDGGDQPPCDLLRQQLPVEQPHERFFDNLLNPVFQPHQAFHKADYKAKRWNANRRRL